MTLPGHNIKPHTRHVTDWGPRRTPRRRRSRRWSAAIFLGLLVVPDRSTVLSWLIVTALAVGAFRLARKVRPVRRWVAAQIDARRRRGRVDLSAVRARIAQAGGGAFLGVVGRRWRLARPERAVLVLGPPRSGKSAGLIIPTVLSCPGPVLCTSTKPDVLRATAQARRQVGRVWEFAPAGHTAGAGETLRWSPVTAALSWDGALMIARAMIAGARVGAGTTDSTHWAKRASALLAALLHATALDG